MRSFACSSEGMRIERGGALWRGGQRAAIDAVGRGGEQVAEQQGLHAHQRQHADHRAILFGQRVVGGMAEALRNHPRPGGKVEETALRSGAHEGIPGD